MTMWTILNGARGHPDDILGLLPMIFDSNDPRPAREQANERYAHGGGWNPQEGWELNPSNGNAMYPGDPPMWPLAMAELNDERLYLYPYGYVAVVQQDGGFEMCRMD